MAKKGSKILEPKEDVVKTPKTATKKTSTKDESKTVEKSKDTDIFDARERIKGRYFEKRKTVRNKSGS